MPACELALAGFIWRTPVSKMSVLVAPHHSTLVGFDQPWWQGAFVNYHDDSYSVRDHVELSLGPRFQLPPRFVGGTGHSTADAPIDSLHS